MVQTEGDSMDEKRLTTQNTEHTKSESLYKDETYAIYGAVFEVYRQMGCGFLEAVYQECLEKELKERGIPFVSQGEMVISYKGEPLTQTYRADLVCFDKIAVEMKASKEIAPEHKAQLLNYLRASGLRLGLIVNFGHYPQAEIVRIAL
jgi:GxxExxY protein